MTFFFFVVGLEVRREFDVGELRERRRLALPVLAGLGGMVVPIAIYLAVNAGAHSAHGWGVAMSTDTAFALGMLALVGPRLPDRLRGFMLTIVVVDDVVALLVIAVAYSRDVALEPLLIATGVFGLVLVARAAGIRHGLVYFLLAAVTWVALFESGVDPVVLGLAVGLITWAYPAGRSELERATNLFRSFREQPTPELARSARVGLRAAVSPNARLLQLYHPWTSYVIVPLFALANVGIAIDGDFLSRAYSSPITLGILFAYVLGKPVGVTGASWLVTRLSGGRLRPPVGWAATVGGGAIAGIGFTVSLLIAALAFHGVELREAKLGVLSAALCASALTWLVFRATALLPRSGAHPRPARQLGGACRPGRAGGSRSRSPARSRRGGGDRRRVRGLRVPLLRQSRAGRARVAGRLRRRPLRLAPPPALGRPPERRACRRGCPRRRPPRGRSGRCTTCCSTTRAT